MKRLRLELKDVILLLTVGVLLPVALLTAVGIVSIAQGRGRSGMVVGLLVLCFAFVAASSTMIAVIRAARKIHLARLQSDFIANISHELRTPLANIRLHTQTLQSGLLSGDARHSDQCLAVILRESARLETMLDGLLDWRAAAGNMLPLRWQSRPIEQAVQDAVSRFEVMTPPDAVSLTRSETSRHMVRHDPNAISTVLLNLLTNAFKYSGEDKRIEITSRDDGGTVVLCVRDNGIGIPTSEMDHVFEPFYRCAHARSKGAGGAGLGLAIARSILRRHGGEIRAQPRPDGRSGALFTIRLPSETPEDAS